MVDELFELAPGLRHHFPDALLTELKEKIDRCGDPKYAHATITLIETIEDGWKSRG